MSMPASGDEVFQVPYAGGPARSSTVSAGLSIATAVLATVLGIGLVVVMWSLALDEDGGLLLGAAAVVITTLVVAGTGAVWRPVRAQARARRNRASATIAMEVSSAGVGFPDLDRGGWIVVPWPMITAARVLSWREVRFLHVEVSRDIRAGAPGSTGLDDPAAVRDLVRPHLGLVGPRFALTSLGRTPEEIDGALRRFSDGRVHVG